jgi:N-acetylglucosamine kinase-like BadF-type ATPase
MRELIVGMDAGGTKLAVRAETIDGTRVADVTFPAEDWNASPAESAAVWLIARMRRVVDHGDEVVALGVGAQGCDTQEHCLALAAALTGRGVPAVVVNDAALLLPAAGLDDGLAVISGTGAIGVSRSASGAPLFAGGWGWILGDEAGAAGLVRIATVLALTAEDDGVEDDGLLSALQDAFGVTTAEALARTVNDESTPEHWGPKAPAIFQAADNGSGLAIQAIDAAALHLTTLVSRLRDKHAVGTSIVAAGSMIVNQPRLFEAFRSRLVEAHPDASVTLLLEAPVAGGIVLARRLLETAAS